MHGNEFHGITYAGMVAMLYHACLEGTMRIRVLSCIRCADIMHREGWEHDLRCGIIYDSMVSYMVEWKHALWYDCMPVEVVAWMVGWKHASRCVLLCMLKWYHG